MERGRGSYGVGIAESVGGKDVRNEKNHDGEVVVRKPVPRERS